MMAEGWRKDEDWPRRRLQATAAWQQARARRPWARLGRHKRGHRLRGVDAPAEAEEFGGTRIAPLGRAIAPFSPPDANLLGPGPTEPSAEVLAAMATPLVGFFDEPYFRLCDEVNTMLRYVWQTANANTCAIPGTGTAAWDAAISNLIGPGEVVVCFCNGKFSDKSA